MQVKVLEMPGNRTRGSGILPRKPGRPANSRLEAAPTDNYSPMPKSACKRSACPISYSLDVFGDRWTLLVLRDLVLREKQRYREFLASDEGIASNILSDRLRRLEEAGIATREVDPLDGRQVIYAVTEKGRSLVPLLMEMAAWGASHDSETGAPSRFAERYYADRLAFHANPGEQMAALFAEDEASE